jgi:hypothetical protein
MPQNERRDAEQDTFKPSLVKRGRQKGGEELLQGVDDPMRRVLRAGAQMERRQKLGARADRQPQPEHLLRTPQPGAQFVQVQVREVEMAEGAFVQELRVLASTSQPGGDGGLSKAEDPFGGGRIEPFGPRREHYGDLVRRGFQTIQGGVASRTERGAAGLTTKGLDVLGTAMLAIADESVDLSIGDPEGGARSVGAGEACGVHADGALPDGF